MTSLSHNGAEIKIQGLYCNVRKIFLKMLNYKYKHKCQLIFNSNEFLTLLCEMWIE